MAADTVRRSRTAGWRGVDDPFRVDTCSVEFGEDRLSAVGSQLAADYSAAWQLVTASDWVTRELSVQVFGHGWRRSLDLYRAADGIWTADVEQHGDVDLAAPGLVDPDGLSRAVDCDLGLCPLTNVMPIRRLHLHEVDAPATLLEMAWVEMPSLRVVHSEQWYSSTNTSSGSREIHFASDDFTANLSVDDAGIVVDYPELAQRI